MNQETKRSYFGLIAVYLCWIAASSTLVAQVPGILNYQGRVSVNGTNFTGNGLFKFALVDGGADRNRQATGVALRAGKFVYEINVTDGGLGYTSPPDVQIVGGGGTGAQAVATVENGVITWIEVFNPGNNYTSTPAVVIGSPQQDLIYETFWSHDGSSSNGIAPSGSVSIAANKGLFSALVGGSSMLPVPPSVFTNTNVSLRVWFSPGGTNPFEQLTPDQRITAVGYAMRSHNSASAETALSASNAANAQNAMIANTVADGSITAAKIASNSITPEKIAHGSIGSQALAAGAVSSWQVVGSDPITAAPNTKYLMPEDGSGVLTLPAHPPIGTTVEVSGRGAVVANAGQLISGLWHTADTNLSVSQIAISDDGRIVLAYSSTGKTLRVLIAGEAYTKTHSTPSMSNSMAGGSWSGIAASGNGSTILGFFESDSPAHHKLYTSTNFGETWAAISLPDSLKNLNQFNSVSCSGHGSVFYAVGVETNSWSNVIIKSSDSGATWQVPGAFPEGLTSVAWSNSLQVSDDGQTVMTVGSRPNGIALLRSTDGAGSWSILDLASTLTNGHSIYLDRFTMSSDGLTLAIPGGGSPAGERVVVASTNGGTSWETNTTHPTNGGSYGLSPLVLSGDGKKLYSAVSAMAGLFSLVELSTDLGKSWRESFRIQPRAPNAQIGRVGIDWSGTQVAFSSADSMYYASGGLYVSAGDKLALEQDDSAVELIYRGSEKWFLVLQNKISSSLGGVTPPPTPLPTPHYYPFP